MNMYLCSPYSHPDPAVRQHRFDAVCQYAAKLMSEGHNVFSPIAHSHPISLHLDNSLDHDFWLKQDLSFLERWADEMVVLCLPGWGESKGIVIEIKAAEQAHIPIREVKP